jgi:hypothetical protein
MEINTGSTGAKTVPAFIKGEGNPCFFSGYIDHINGLNIKIKTKVSLTSGRASFLFKSFLRYASNATCVAGTRKAGTANNVPSAA